MKSAFYLFFISLIFANCSMFNDMFTEVDRLWVEVASGERQCIPPTYASLDDAINQLTANGIKVFDKEEVNMIVCRACTCPTGTTYRAYINESDLENAQELGWREVD